MIESHASPKGFEMVVSPSAHATPGRRPPHAEGTHLDMNAAEENEGSGGDLSGDVVLYGDGANEDDIAVIRAGLEQSRCSSVYSCADFEAASPVGDCGTAWLASEEEDAMMIADETELGPENGSEVNRLHSSSTCDNAIERVVRSAPQITAAVANISQNSQQLKAELQHFKMNTGEAITSLQQFCMSSIHEISRQSATELAVLRKELEVALQEKRHLHNCIQEMKGNIRVFCRVRPQVQSSESVVECRRGGQILTVSVPSKGIDRTGKPRPPDLKTFTFDAVFGPSSSQQDVYDEVRGFVNSAFDGYHCTVIAYGQTGAGECACLSVCLFVTIILTHVTHAGKTFTMQGTNACPGISKNMLRDVFDAKLKREASGLQSVAVRVSMIEVYNETFRVRCEPELCS
jgi:hypothetical protein